eukprot:gene1724-19228_t
MTVLVSPTDCSYSAHSNYVRCLLPAGPLLVSGSEDTTVRLWDTASASHLHTVRHHSAGVHGLARVGDEVWSAAGDGTIVVWGIGGEAAAASPVGDGVGGQSVEREAAFEPLRARLSRLPAHDGAVLSLHRVGMRVYAQGGWGG